MELTAPPSFPPPFAGEVSSGAPLATPAPQAGEEGAQEIRRVAEEFEALVLAELLQPTFAQIDPNGLGGGGAGEEMFRPMLVQQYAAGMARAGGVGLADAVVRELTRLQTMAAPPAEESNGADR
jgi:Rod binding domain-containing protein